jgi:hypothetical protein
MREKKGEEKMKHITFWSSSASTKSRLILVDLLIHYFVLKHRPIDDRYETRMWKKEERIPRLSAILRYRVLSGGSFESPIFVLQLLLVVALERRPAWRRVPPLNHFSSLYTLTSHKGRCMSHVISMHRPGDPRQTAVSNLSKVIVFLVASRFQHSTLVVCAKQHNHSAIAAHENVTAQSSAYFTLLYYLFKRRGNSNFNYSN